MDLLGKRSWGMAGETDVPVVSCNAGARKRFGTIQMCVAGDGKAQHPRIAVIFRGKGGVIIREQDQYHPLAPCPILAIDLSVLQFHQAPSPISVIHLSELLFHQAPSPILLIDLSVLLFHQAPSPILRIDLSVLMFHQAPSPLLAIALPGRVGPEVEVARQCQHAGKSD